MTISLLEFVGILGLIALIVAVVAFVRLANRITRTARELEHATKRVAALTPNVQALLDNGEAGLVELRALTRTTSQIAGDLRAVTGEARAATAHLVGILEHRATGRYAAIIAGARAGLDVLRRVRGGNGSDSIEERVGISAAQ